MKPINVIVFSAATLLMIAGSAVILGWTTERGSFLLVGKLAFGVAFVVACIPLIALGASVCWMKVTRWLLRSRGRTTNMNNANGKQQGHDQ